MLGLMELTRLLSIRWLSLAKNYRLLEASIQEVTEALKLALLRGRQDDVEFWREVLLERVVALSAAITNNPGAPGADSPQ
jgi:hypothetical protein